MTRSQQKRNTRLRNARRAAGLNQFQLAEKIGVSEKTVQRWEAGQATPQPIALQALCEKLAKTPEALGFGDPEEALPEEEDQPAPQQIEQEQCREKQRQSTFPLPVPLMKRIAPLPPQRNLHLMIGIITILVVATLVGGSVMVAFLHLPIFGLNGCGQPFSGMFHGQLDARWQFDNPTEDGNRHIDPQGHLIITAPPNSDLNTNRGHNLNAPRLLQSITGNFTIQTHLQVYFTAKHFPGSIMFQSAGLLLWQDEHTFLRFERADGKENGVLFQRFVPNPASPPITQSRNHLTSAQSLDLRVQKQGDHFTVFWQEPGHKWQIDGETDLHFDHLMVGLDVLSYYGAPSTTATFTSFTVDCA